MAQVAQESIINIKWVTSRSLDLLESSQNDDPSGVGTVEPWYWDGKGTRADCNSKFLETGFLSDLTLLVGVEKEEIKAHRLFLQMGSPIFHRIFEKNPDLDILVIPDVDCSAFKIFLQYLYSCSETLTQLIKMENAQPLLAIASKLQVEDLARVCATTLKGKVTDKNALKLFQHGMEYGNKDLMEASLLYISKKAWKIIEQEEFMKLSKDLIVEIAQRDDLIVLSEIQLFNALVRWGNAECDRKGIDPSSLTTNGETNLRTVLNTLIPMIRFPVMDEVEFIETVLTKEIVTMEEGFAIMCMQRIPLDRRASLHGIRGTGKFSAKARNYYKRMKYSAIWATEESRVIESKEKQEMRIFEVSENVALLGIKLRKEVFNVYMDVYDCKRNKGYGIYPHVRSAQPIDKIGWSMFKAHLMLKEAIGTQEVILLEREFKPFLPDKTDEILFETAIELQANKKYSIEIRFSGSLTSISEKTTYSDTEYSLATVNNCSRKVRVETEYAENLEFNFHRPETEEMPSLPTYQGLFAGLLFEEEMPSLPIDQGLFAGLLFEI